MALNERIRVLREINHWTQEQMAEKMQMSKSGYAKIEQGRTKVNTERLAQIAEIFEIDVAKLLAMGLNGSLNLIQENGNYNYYTSEKSLAEIEKLNLIIQHQQEIIRQKDEMIVQKENENELLKKIIAKWDCQS